MDYQAQYKEKLMSAEEAVRCVKSGDWVDYGHFIMGPTYLDAHLAKRRDELENVKISALNFPKTAEIAACDPTRTHFVYNTWHVSGPDRKLHDRDLCNYIPILYHEGAQMTEMYHVPDVFMVRVAPMDRHGFFNFSITNSFHAALAKKARKVIVEVNNHAPVCLGGSDEGLHISQVDIIVESDHQPIEEVLPGTAVPVDHKVAAHVIGLIEDGCVIQLGIGAMPNLVGQMIAQSDLKDLGGHTEMLVDAYVDMYESGVMTGKRKAFDTGKLAYTFAMGTKRLYDFLDQNPVGASYPAHHTNDPAVLAAHDRFVAINNAIEIDLYGQVCSESAGVRQISGTGGQLDCIYSAFHSKGGKGIICISSIQEGKNGEKRSRIVPTLPPGGIVTLPRSMVNYVITEYGVANLKGKSTWQRAELLIGLAHPGLREGLIKEAEKMKIWLKSNR
jgi:butyryl-CoA:acetate CoA-transferase